MIIRKLFRFEASHIVRGCSTERCKLNVHGHSFVVELFIQSDTLDNAEMVIDFGLLKDEVRSFIDCFDHTHLLWNKEETKLNQTIKSINERWIEFPFNPTSEALALYMHYTIDKILQQKKFKNGEGDMKVKSVRLHETATGYAETEQNEQLLMKMPLEPGHVKYSPAILKSNPSWTNILKTI